jgi:predicted P-loop ATPase
MGVLGHNEFTAGHEILRQPPAPVLACVGDELEDRFDTEVVRYLERRGVFISSNRVREVVDATAHRNSSHPVREYLNSLKWDREQRLGCLLVKYFGAELSDVSESRYLEQVGQKFLISAVARVFEPGCKADQMLVLEGEQGIGKSSAVRILAGDDWYTDQVAALGSKDSSMQVRGVWIVEMSELAAFGRTEVERVKQFLSQQDDRIRVPYGHRVVRWPRQCVFVGTTNTYEWLKDEEGRRFWPVRCHEIDLKRLRDDRDQLWAEAVHRYRKGVKWWLEDGEVIREAQEEQRQRYQLDVWHNRVIEFAEAESASVVKDHNGNVVRRGSVSITEILTRLHVPVERQDQAAANRVARCLKFAGWKRANLGPRGAREWRYRDPDPKSSQDGGTGKERWCSGVG